MTDVPISEQFLTGNIPFDKKSIPRRDAETKRRA